MKLTPKAYRDLDSIFDYIAGTLSERGNAERTAKRLESAILSLREFPYRGAMRRTSVFANKDYRQLFSGRYAILYRVDEAEKEVVIVTVVYASSDI